MFQININTWINNKYHLAKKASPMNPTKYLLKKWRYDASPTHSLSVNKVYRTLAHLLPKAHIILATKSDITITKNEYQPPLVCDMDAKTLI